MSELVTFVFTDLVGSVDLKRRMPGAGAAERDRAYVEQVLTPHRERIEQGLAEARGRVVSTAGDGHFLAFTDTIRAARWAIEVQQSHDVQPLCEFEGEEVITRVRIGLHVGVPQVDPGDENNFIGRAVDYAARLADRAVAGQILLSRSAASLVEDAGLDEVRLHSHGSLALRGIGEVEVHEILYADRAPTKPRRDGGGEDQREWTVLPMTMGLTEYAAKAASSSGSSVYTSTAVPVKRVGNYELLDLIGAGGMGNVYRARHALFGRTRAVKIIKPELVDAGGESVVQRFYQEIQATGSLEHPNLVVAIESSTPEDDLHFLVMEYIEGLGADELISEQGALEVADACEITRQAALGLEHLHSQGLVHRDVKPSNVMLTCIDDQSSGPELIAADAVAKKRIAVAKLMDLGLALLVGEDQQRLTRMDQGGMGTGHYMSPEQWRSTTVDIRADIYSLGCMLFHLLHGKPPYAESDLRPEIAHQREPLPSLRGDLPRELSGLIHRMLAKNPEDRPQRPLEVAHALAPLASGHHLVGLIERRSRKSRLAAGSQNDTLRTGQAELDTRSPRRIDLDHRGAALSKHDPTRRRLLTVAAVATGAIAIGLGWIASGLHEQNLQQRREALESSARSDANLMAEQIKKRFRALENLAKGDDLRGWLLQIDANPDDETLWEGPQAWIIDQKLQSDQEFKSSSWFLTNAHGLQVARATKSDSIGRSYAHRDYFHGQGQDKDPAEAANSPPPAIQSPHQSTVYKSTSTNKLKVAFSVPVWNKNRGEGRRVIGVLAMSFTLGDFSALTDSEKGASSTEILLADTGFDYIERDEQDEPIATRGLILHHQLLSQHIDEHPRLPEEMLQQIMGRQPIDGARILTEYPDLLGRRGKRYWGSYARIVLKYPEETRQTSWVIIAQEKAP